METLSAYVNAKAKFLRYQHGTAYFALSVPYSERLYSFPVPLNQVQDGKLTAENQTIHMMDFIRKAIHEGTLNPEY